MTDRIDVPHLKRTLLDEVETHRALMAAEPARGRGPSRAVPRRRVIAVMALLLVGLMTGGVAAQGAFSNTEMDPDRQIAPGDAADAIDRLGAGIPLPPGGGFGPLRDSLQPAWQDEDGFRGMLEFNAICQWYAHWMHARWAGDHAAMETARATMVDMVSWSALHDELPETVRRLEAAASAGHDQTVRRFLDVNCDASSGWEAASSN
jgi:hypothetical protein